MVNLRDILKDAILKGTIQFVDKEESFEPVKDIALETIKGFVKIRLNNEIVKIAVYNSLNKESI